MVDHHGLFVWYELLTTDVSAAQSFYGKVVGWDVQDTSTSEFGYRLFGVGGTPVAGAEIVVAGKAHVTDRRGEARIDVTPGSIELTVVKEGFAPVTTSITVAGGQQQPVCAATIESAGSDN